MPLSLKQATISKKSVLLICVFLVGFITQHPHSLIIYTSNQNWRIACLLKSVSAVRKHVSATHFVAGLPRQQPWQPSPWCPVPGVLGGMGQLCPVPGCAGCIASRAEQGHWDHSPAPLLTCPPCSQQLPVTHLFLLLSFIFSPCSYACSFILVTEEYWDGKLLSLPILEFAWQCYCCVCTA